MKLQRILAKDSRSANEEAIAKYGRDVLIVSNSRVNGMTELIVAVDVQAEPTPAPQMPRSGGEPFEAMLRQQSQAAAPVEPHPAAVAETAAQGFMPAHMALMQAAKRAAAQTLSPHEATQTATAAVSGAQPVEQEAASRWGGAEPSAPGGEITRDKAFALTEMIRSEIAQLRKEMRMGQQLQAWAAQGPTHRWNEALTEVGVPTALRALLVSGLSNDYDDGQALSAIESQMSENLPRSARKSATAPWSKGVHLLSGPCGSGKTSMAARLAQEAAQRLGVDRVTLVSWNDNRPGAWGQLQLWASRIGVTALRASDSATLELLIREHGHGLLIIDSGLVQPQTIAAALQGVEAIHHLVMPADALPATLRRWFSSEAPSWADVLVTRLDESSQPWGLLQACCEHGLLPAMASHGAGLDDLSQPYGPAELLQHGMRTLAGAMGAGSVLHGASGHPLDIAAIEPITAHGAARPAARGSRAKAAPKPPARAAKPAVAKPAPRRGRQGAAHA